MPRRSAPTVLGKPADAASHKEPKDQEYRDDEQLAAWADQNVEAEVGVTDCGVEGGSHDIRRKVHRDGGTIVRAIGRNVAKVGDLSRPEVGRLSIAAFRLLEKVPGEILANEA